MRNLWQRQLMAGGVGLLLALDAVAGHYQPDVTILHDETRIEVAIDGSWQEDRLLEVRANTQSAVADGSQIQLPYNRDRETLEIIAAETHTATGDIFAVPTQHISDVEARVHDAPVFGAQRMRQVVFPWLQTGGSTLLHWRVHAHQALWPNGQFDYAWEPSLHAQTLASLLTVSVPSGMSVHWQATGLAPPRVSEAAGRRRWTWTWQQPVPPAPEAHAVDEADYSPFVALSTFADYAALGQAYWQGAHDKATVTPAVQQLAQQITLGKLDEHARAVALYDWVSKHIRWVAIYFGNGGLVPHRADEVLRNGYGDCKDHATLLQALLVASGIRADQVLIDAGGRYRLPLSAPSHTAFNHAINYLPDEHLFVDSTLAEAPFGQLSASEYGKQALVIDAQTGRGVLMPTPIASSARDQERVQTEMTLLPDGSLRGTSLVQPSGAPALSARLRFSDLAHGAEADLALRMLQASGQSGAGSYRAGQPEDLDVAFSYQTDFVLPAFLSLDTPGASVIPQGLRGLNGLASPFDASTSRARVFPLRLQSGLWHEETQWRLPTSLVVLALPADVELHTRFGRYQAHYQQQGPSVMVVRELQLDWPTPWISPADYPDFAAMGVQVLHDLAAQVLYAPR